MSAEHGPARASGAGSDLERALGAEVDGEVRFDRVSRGLYATDASVYQLVPAGVVIPRTTEALVRTVEVCRRFGTSITARGGGTSQAGQAIGNGVVVDCSKYLNRVLEVDATARRARVEPGCVLDELNTTLAPHGLMFAPDISTSDRATVGGMVANNSAGARSIVYGTTVDHVEDLRVVLSDGSVFEAGPLAPDALTRLRGEDTLAGRAFHVACDLAGTHASEIDARYPKVLRRVGGYNLDRLPSASRPAVFNAAHLLVGSEGTLALTLEAGLKLVERPRATGLVVFEFTDLLDALSANVEVLAHAPAASEVVDEFILDSTRLNREAAELRGMLRADTTAILMVELHGEGQADLEPRLRTLERAIVGDGRCRASVTTDTGAQARFWKLRRLALGLSMAQKGDAKGIPFVEDAAVAPERLRDYIAELLEVVRRHGTKAGVYAHASVGCLHVRPVVDLKTDVGLRQFEGIASDVADLVLKYGGALSGEHGDGLVRSPFQSRMFGPVLYEAFRAVKRAFDPEGLFNPGKIVDAPPLASNLRVAAIRPHDTGDTAFDFSADGGIVRAAELCVGVGACRRTLSGSMCPSYRATRDERDSTRGRADTLRLAFTGQLGLDAWNDDDVRAVLDLCLECKACKTECPTNVDMARLKAELLYQRGKRLGVSTRSRLFGRIGRHARLGTSLTPLSNWIVRSHLVRTIGDRALGIDRRRTPPAFAPRPFTKRMADVGPVDHPDVVLFPDTFVEYFEPGLGESAVSVLERAGLRVRIGAGSRLLCCGRPLISNGMLDEAREHARVNVEALHPWARDGVTITACEPSCLLTLVDDYPALLRGDERRRAEAVAASCRTFEAVVASAGPLPIAGNESERVLVQTHCHQRALVGTAPTLDAVGQLGADVVDLEAGCCGMAGAFGFEREHYEISRLVGEHRLFPALRAAPAGALIVAPGFSCRRQIEHFTGRRAVHPAEALAARLLR